MVQKLDTWMVKAVLKYSGHAMWFGLVLGQQLWQLNRLAWKTQEFQRNLFFAEMLVY